jgi:hypothetical protein
MTTQQTSEPAEELCPVLLAVRILDFQSDDTGSSPVPDTIFKRI